MGNIIVFKKRDTASNADEMITMPRPELEFITTTIEESLVLMQETNKDIYAMIEYSGKRDQELIAIKNMGFWARLFRWPYKKQMKLLTWKGLVNGIAIICGTYCALTAVVLWYVG